MMLEPIGLITVAVAFVCLWLHRYALVAVLIPAALLGSAAAINLPSISIQPAYLLLGFCILSTIAHNREASAALRAFRPGTPGFWLLCLIVYGYVTAFFLPRILMGVTQIVPLGTSEFAETGTTVPLGPVSSNLTQAAYMTANLVCFGIVSAAASRPRGFEVILASLLAACMLNAFFALVDIATYTTGTQDLLNFVRNARYTLHDEEEILGLKRIVGSFPEASAFARYTLGLFGFSATLLICGYRTNRTGPLALASALLVVLSTSSSGLVGMLPLCLVLYATALMRCGARSSGKHASLIVLFVPQIAVAIGLFALIEPAPFAPLFDYVDTVVLTKSTSDSGISRAAWNVYALQNFLDTWGFGVGLGTVRTSGYLYALMAGGGVIGMLCYGCFLAGIVLGRRGSPRTPVSDIRSAGRNACLGLLFADLLVSPSIDQGLLFSCFAALACSQPERATDEEPASSDFAGAAKAASA